MTNKEIRKQARKLYRQDFWRLFLAFALMLAPGLVNVAINLILDPTGQIPAKALTAITFCITVLACPLAYGVTGLFFDEFHGIRGPVKSVARFYRDKRHLGNALILGLTVNAVVFILSRLHSWVRLLAERFPPSEAPLAWTLSAVIVPIVPLAVLILYVLVYCRLFLVSYVYVRKPGQRPLDTIKESLEQTKGHVFDLIAFGFSVFWWFAVLVIIAFVMLTLFVMAGMQRAFLMTVAIAVMGLPLFLLCPYIHLCLAGFAARLLSGK